MKYQQHLLVYDTYANHTKKRPTPKKAHTSGKLVTALLALVVLLGLGYEGVHAFAAKTKPNQSVSNVSNQQTATTINHSTTPPVTTTKAVTTPPPSTPCTTNQTPQIVIISISQRHMWACTGTTDAFDSAVVTGDTNVVADNTPTGTYKIYAKETSLYLNGSDNRGSWHDWVYYWMPFYDSPAYGIFGFHDATWRSSTDFGNIDPSSDQASHGCVELPLGVAQQLYNWASVGTAVSIQA